MPVPRFSGCQCRSVNAPRPRGLLFRGNPMKKLILILLMALGVVPPALAADPVPFQKPTTWAPYFHDPENGKESNLQGPIEKIDSKAWIGLQWTDFKGAKLRMAVMPVENKATFTPGGTNMASAIAQAYGAQMNAIPVNGIEDLLGSGLQATNRFRLFERKALESLMAEKGLAANTMVAQTQVAQAAPVSGANPAEAQKQLLEMAAKMQAQQQQDALKQAAGAVQAAKLVGAQYLVYASVVEWTPDKSKKSVGGGGVGVGGGGLGTLFALAGAISKSEAEVAMNFRIVDAQTGEVKWQLDERATAGKWGFGLGGGAVGGSGGGMVAGGMQEKTPINYAVKACINKAIYRIAETLKNQPWRGAVIKEGADGKVYVNAGKDAGLQPGMVLTASSVGEELKDPVTGEVLDSETKPAGKVTITDVRDRIAIGTLNADQGVTLKPGDRLELPADVATAAGGAN